MKAKAGNNDPNSLLAPHTVGALFSASVSRRTAACRAEIRTNISSNFRKTEAAFRGNPAPEAEEMEFIQTPSERGTDKCFAFAKEHKRCAFVE